MFVGYVCLIVFIIVKGVNGLSNNDGLLETDPFFLFGRRESGVGEKVEFYEDMIRASGSFNGESYFGLSIDGQLIQLGGLERDDKCKHIAFTLPKEYTKMIKEMFVVENYCLVQMKNGTLLASDPTTGLYVIEGTFKDDLLITLNNQFLVGFTDTSMVIFSTFWSGSFTRKEYEVEYDQIKTIKLNRLGIIILFKNEDLFFYDIGRTRYYLIASGGIKMIETSRFGFFGTNTTGHIWSLDYRSHKFSFFSPSAEIVQFKPVTGGLFARFRDKSWIEWKFDEEKPVFHAASDTSEVIAGERLIIEVKNDQKSIFAFSIDHGVKGFYFETDAQIQEIYISSYGFYIFYVNGDIVHCDTIPEKISPTNNLGFTSYKKVIEAGGQLFFQVDDFHITEVNPQRKQSFVFDEKIRQIKISDRSRLHILLQNGKIVIDPQNIIYQADVVMSGELVVTSEIKSITLSKGIQNGGGIMELVNGQILQFGITTKEIAVQNGDLSSKFAQFSRNFEIQYVHQSYGRNIVLLRDKYESQDDIVYCWNNTHEIVIRDKRIKHIKNDFFLTESGEIYHINGVENIRLLTDDTQRVDRILNFQDTFSILVGITQDGDLIFSYYENGTPKLKLFAKTTSIFIDCVTTVESSQSFGAIALSKNGSIRIFSFSTISQPKEVAIGEELAKETSVIKLISSKDTGLGFQRVDKTIGMIEYPFYRPVLRDLSYAETKFDSVFNTKLFVIATSQKSLYVLYKNDLYRAFEMPNEQVMDVKSSRTTVSVKFSNETVISYKKKFQGTIYPEVFYQYITDNVEMLYSNEDSFCVKLNNGTVMGYGEEIHESFVFEGFQNQKILADNGVFASFEPKTVAPSTSPSRVPTAAPVPTVEPTNKPTTTPTGPPSESPTIQQTNKPTTAPTAGSSFSGSPTESPTVQPTFAPIMGLEPTNSPTPKEGEQQTSDDSSIIIIASSVSVIVIVAVVAIGLFILYRKQNQQPAPHVAQVVAKPYELEN